MKLLNKTDLSIGQPAEDGEGVDGDGDADEDEVAHGQRDQQLVEGVRAHRPRPEDDDRQHVRDEAHHPEDEVDQALAPPEELEMDKFFMS